MKTALGIEVAGSESSVTSFSEEPSSWARVSGYSEICGESFYVFDESRFRKNYRRLSTAFTARYPRTQIAYSYKTNYTPAICRIVDDLGGYAEVVSEMEYELAARLGVSGNRIIFNGPYKSSRSVHRALHAGSIVNLDSSRDYATVMQVAAESPGIRFSVGLRCNFAVPGCEASRFGFDVDGPEFRSVIEGIRGTRNLVLAGLHCHFPVRQLDSFRVRSAKMIEVARKVFPSPPAFLNLGGGLFGEMPESLRRLQKAEPPGFQEYAAVIGEALHEAYGSCDPAPVLYIEPGTALVADTLRFYTKVVGTKDIRGRRIATVAGSIFNISPHARLSCLPVRVIRRSGDAISTDAAAAYDIAGYTCIESDYLSKGIPGPIEDGDFLEYQNVGSYSIVMKPPFILPNVPMLRYAGPDKPCDVIKSQETAEAIFSSFAGI